MNYLAHAFLSNNDENLLLGNFIADHLRGNKLDSLPEKIKQGVLLHRNIDSFTDAHPEFRKAKRFFYQGFEKHSGILVDIYFDHLLASNFGKYHQQNLSDFSFNAYKVYQKNLHHIPETASRFLNYVLQNNIYTSYSEFEGIKKVLFHLSQRIKHNVKLNESDLLFIKYEKELNASFEIFFSDAIKVFIP